ncbi:serine hydrolase [Paracidovorax wautersii]|uniref:D-alanyl-D-alanine endopeptidase (Penicillin-binding protein 7) n=1 Tax=Paracidovorax wautersii TaxID=1177982 RepID=A0ABU1IGM2_9BURK|nr:serine hydrolase [Paracidovorax wautersii]MDR6215957.1 D-alanyl-D-alanine endopeptidase (penicillin-binding protein 7) [Paracidovorax wautersii]
MQPRPRIATRFFHALALATLSCSLIAPGVHAGERKRAPAKKEVVAKKSVVRKAAVVDRKAVTRVKATRVMAKSAKAPARVAAVVPERLSFGQIAGLHQVVDPLDLKSSVALVMDQDTHEVLLSKNDHAVLPIASITKLMTGLLISQARLPMDEAITITQDDVDTEKFSSSRLAVGTTLTRGELLHLALMASENRAAHALGRTFPGGMDVFVAQMNAKARLLGMTETRYVEPTGLSSRNQSSARDLATLVNIAHGDPLLRELTTSPSYEVAVGRRSVQFNNTNRLVKSPAWDIGLQKTGYISEAGRCLVMQAQVSGRKLIMVFLDSAGKFSRLGDAERVRNWVEKTPSIGSAPTLHAGTDVKG